MEDMRTEPAGPQNSNSKVINAPALMTQQPAEFLKWQFENDELVERLKWRLKGMEYNHSKKGFVKVCKPMLNESGVFWVLTAVETFTDKMFHLTNYESEEITDMAERFEHDLVYHLFAHAKDYGLNITADLRMVHNIVSNTVMASIKRSLKGKTYQGLSMGFQHTEITSAAPEKKQGLFSRFLPRTI